MIVLLFLTACGGDSSTPAPTLNIGLSPASVPAGQTAMLSWSSNNASMCQASGAWTGSESTSGSLGVWQTAPGTYTYTLACSSTSSGAASGSATLTVTPGAAPLSILTTALPNGVVGTSYSQTLQAAGGVAPFTWTVSSGALPHGLSLSISTTNTVTVSGTPDTGTQGVAFAIQVGDTVHQTATQPFTLSMLLQADSLVLSPGALAFSNQAVGSASAALAETLTNTATSALAISGITIAGSNATEFNQKGTTCSGSLAAGASCSISVTFTPGQMGPRTAALTINDDTLGSPHSLSLNGIGLTNGSNITLSTVSLPFGTQLVGTTSPQRSVTVNNYGTLQLNIASITAGTPFAETDDCVPSVAPGDTCTINATFTPAGSGDVTGTLSISDDASGSPQLVSLSGTGSGRTPLLTGYCFATCRGAIKSSQCPAGQPAEHPGREASYPCGPINSPGVAVDEARRCEVPPPLAPYGYGYCEID